MNCRFLSEEVQERLEHFRDFSAKEKIKALEAILKGKEKKVFCEKRGTKIVIPSLKKIEEKYEAIRFCLEQCKDQELVILNLELDAAKKSLEASVGFNLGLYALVISGVALVVSSLSDARKDIFFSPIVLILLYGLACAMLVFPWLIRIDCESKVKQLTYVLELIEQRKNERNKGDQKDGNTYIVTVKKES